MTGIFRDSPSMDEAQRRLDEARESAHAPDVDWSDEDEPDEEEPYYDPDEDPDADVTA